MLDTLELVKPIINKEIESNHIAGAHMAVLYKGDIVFNEVFGMADREKDIRMGKDQIFRLYSLSKPITATAMMILVERGIIETRYPIRYFLPTFAGAKVLDEQGLRDANRDITIADLLNMTAGIPYPEGTPSGQKMGEVWGRQSYRYDQGEPCLSTRDFVLEMGKVPLSFQPGEHWMYGSCADVCGAIIETVSGMKFSEFLKKEIFEPLGMKDTGFYVPESEYHRLAQVYEINEKGESQPYTGHNLCTTDYRKPPAFESGGAGLASTVADYTRFVSMLINGGNYGGVRILGRKTVELMTRNSLSERLMSELSWDSMKGQGYGCFMRNLQDPAAAGIIGSIGEFGWDGWLGCYVSIDPTEELAMLYFVQQTNLGCTDVTRKLQNIVWSSL